VDRIAPTIKKPGGSRRAGRDWFCPWPRSSLAFRLAFVANRKVPPSRAKPRSVFHVAHCSGSSRFQWSICYDSIASHRSYDRDTETRHSDLKLKRASLHFEMKQDLLLLFTPAGGYDQEEMLQPHQATTSSGYNLIRLQPHQKTLKLPGIA
jgi:hypothetical protein